MATEVRIPNVAIHLIFKHAIIEQVKASEDPERFIELLVKTYNAEKEKEGKESHKFRSVPNLNWDRKAHNEIHLKAYYSRRVHMNKAAMALDALTTKSFEREFQSVSLHFAYFCFFAVKSSKEHTEKAKTQKVWAVFALTTYDAFRLTRPYCDYAFPTKIAFRILVPKVGKEHNKPLIGPKEGSSTVYKNPSSLKTQEHQNLWVLYTNYDAPLKPHSSLRPYLSIDPHRPLGIHVGEGMIRIGMSLTLSQYALSLPHLLEIRRGTPTMRTDEGQEVDDPDFQVFANIQRVHGKFKGSLDDNLIHFLWEATANNKELPFFYLSHWHYRDYFDSTEFTLNYSFSGRKIEVKWFYPPTFLQLVECLHSQFHGITFEDFRYVIGNATFRCNRMSGKRGLMEFIQGEIVYSGDVYFRLDGVWLKILSQHLAATERTFLEIVGECLVTKKNKKGHLLPHPWISKQEWVAFSKKDKPEEVSDEIYDETMKTLQGRTFSVIGSNGKVLLGYPIHEMLSGETLKTVKTVKKKWEELCAWLKAHQGKKIEATQLKDVFPKIHNTVFALLQKQFPICRPLQVGRSSLIPIGANGKVQVLSLDHFEMPKGTPKAVIRYKKEISELLSQEESLEESDFSPAIPSQKYRTAAYKWLTKGHVLKSDFSTRYLAIGPIPSSDVEDELFRTFLEGKHRSYTQVMDEENYSRLYLNEKGYLVFDQVFPGERDKVELFDLLYHGEDGKLYLYAIKEGFNTSTGIACTQIRVAAENLLAAKKSGSDQLSKLYDWGVKTKATSDFRIRLVKDLKKMGKKNFIKLFMEKELIFVYAFLDTNPKDRRLEDQLRLLQQVTLEELEEFEEKKSKRRAILQQLTTKGYLDSNHRLTDKFLRESAEDFQKEMGDTSGKLRKLLMRRVSLFDSMIAKLELIKLYQDLKQMGFEFRIQQLDRPGERAEAFDYSEIDSLSFGLFSSSIQVSGQVYSFSRTPYTIGELLQKFFRQEDSYLCQLLLSQNGEEEEYLDPHYELTETDLQSAFADRECELVIIDEDNPGDPEISEAAIVVIKSGEHYYLTKERPMVLQDMEDQVNEVLDALGDPEISEGIGLKNLGNDCFLNAILQAFVHSGFYETLLENMRPDHFFFPLFRGFLYQYRQAEEDIPTKYLRRSLGISQGLQEDAAEVVGKIFEAFNLDDEVAEIRIRREVNEEVSVVVEKDPASYSQLDIFQEGQVQLMPMIPLEISEETDSFEDCWAQTTSKMDETFHYVQGEEVYQGSQYEQSYSLENSPNFLFIQFKRYKKTKKGIEKIEKEVEIDEVLEIDGQYYEVYAAINHHGDSPTSGHYTCIAWSNGSWWKFDDSTIEEIGDYEAVKSEINTSYILVLKLNENE